MKCHVVGCDSDAKVVRWFPKYQVGLFWCEAHWLMIDKSDLMIDLARAKKDHEDGMNEIGSAFGVPDYEVKEISCFCEHWEKTKELPTSVFRLTCKQCGRVIE